MARRIALPLILMLSLLGTPAVYGEEGTDSLPALLERLDGRLYWDPLREHGSIWRNGRSISFQVGSPWLVLDFAEALYVGEVKRREGRIQFPPGVGDLIVAALTAPPEQPAGRSIAAIFIDPGHGGKDPGTIGRIREDGETKQIFEKDIVLDVATRLHTLLSRAYPDKEVILSRANDVYISLEERTELANSVELEPDEAIIFVSLHANSSFNRDAQGFEVWYLPPDYRRKGLVSEEEVGVDDPDVLTVLNALREEELTIDSVLLAQNILRDLEDAVGDVSPNRGLKEESWYVVRNAKMPSVLVEVGFVSNSEELARLRRPAYLQRIANAIYSGVSTFVQSYQQ